MTDLEVTKLCAKAIGIRLTKDLEAAPDWENYIEWLEDANTGEDYWPLKNGAQALALLWWLVSNGHHVAFETDTRGVSRIGVCDNMVVTITDAQSLRAFLCGCVAKMQEEKCHTK